MKTIVIADISSNHLSTKDIYDSIEFLRSRNCLIKMQAYKKGMFSHLDDYVLPRALIKSIKADDIFYSVFDTETVYWMEDNLDPKYYKLACRSYDDIALQISVQQTGKEVFQSIPHNGVPTNNYFKFLLCVSKYPALNAHLDCFNCNFVGYSDHTTNPIVPAFAVVKGAKIIEHHFSIREMNTPDACVSYLPEQWDIMLKNIEEAENQTRGTIHD